MECAGGLHCPCISSPVQNQLCIPAREQRECENPKLPKGRPRPSNLYVHKPCLQKWMSDANGLAWLVFLPRPMRKLSGLISRCKKDFWWTYSTRLIYKNLKLKTLIYIYNRLVSYWIIMEVMLAYIMYHLIGKHQNSLQGQFSVAKAEKVFKAWPQEVHNKNIVVTLNTKPVDVWNSSCKRK